MSPRRSSSQREDGEHAAEDKGRTAHAEFLSAESGDEPDEQDDDEQDAHDGPDDVAAHHAASGLSEIVVEPDVRLSVSPVDMVFDAVRAIEK